MRRNQKINPGNLTKQGSLTPPKYHTSSLVMDPNQEEISDLPGKEFRLVITLTREVPGKAKFQFKEIKKTIQVKGEIFKARYGGSCL